MVRHIGSFLLALVFAPAVFLLTGTGLSAFATSWVAGGAPEAVLDTAVALGALLLAGALYAVLTMVRLSPVGPFLAGLGLLGMSVWAVAHPVSYEATFAMLKVHMGGAVGQTGLGIVLAVPLLATVGSPRRWKKHDRLADETVALAAYPLQQGRPGTPVDATRQFTAQPGTAYTGLPDVPPPSLHYPKMTPQSVPTVNVPPASAAPTVQIPSNPPAPKAPKAPQAPAAPVADAPPLPRRNPAPPPAAATPSTPQPPNTPQPPAAPQPPSAPQPPGAPHPPSAPQAATPPATPASAEPTQPVAPPPLPEEQTVMLVDPADQQTIKIDKPD